MSVAETAGKMRRLLDDYEAEMARSDPAAARTHAYEMLHVLTGLYNAAYNADMARLRGEGNAL